VGRDELIVSLATKLIPESSNFVTFSIHNDHPTPKAAHTLLHRRRAGLGNV
jgi:hypothetical protein